MSNASIQSDALLVRAKAGDRDATAALLLAHQDRLDRYLDRRIPRTLRSRVAVEDIRQETFRCAFRDIARFEARGERAFLRWLLTIGRMRCVDAIRKHRGAAPRAGEMQVQHLTAGAAESLSMLLSEMTMHQDTPSKSVVRREALEALLNAIDELDDHLRQVVRLRYIDGVSAEEAGRRMGKSPRAVHGLCYRAIGQLRGILGSRSRYL